MGCTKAFSADEMSARSYRLFNQRKPNVAHEWRAKLPDFIKRLEDGLYRAARSQVPF